MAKDKPLPPTLATVPTAREWLIESAGTISNMLSDRIPQEMFIQAAVQEMRRTPDLLKCTSMSLLGGLFELAQLGLMPGKHIGLAYMVPFKNHGRHEATLIIGYRGFIALARREGAHIEGHIVRKGDTFEVDFAQNPPFKHKPNLELDRVDVKAVTDAYSKLTHPDGYVQIEAMNRSELDTIRKNAPSARNSNSAWNANALSTIRMFEKCPTRRLGTVSAFGGLVRAAILDEAGDTVGMSQNLEYTAAEVLNITEIPPEQISQPRTEELPDAPPEKEPPKKASSSAPKRQAPKQKPPPQPPKPQAPPKQAPPPPPPKKQNGEADPLVTQADITDLGQLAVQAGMNRTMLIAWISSRFQEITTLEQLKAANLPEIGDELAKKIQQKQSEGDDE